MEISSYRFFFFYPGTYSVTPAYPRLICIKLSLFLVVYQMAEICLGMLKCIEISYYGYLFATIKDKKHYQMATGCAMAGVMSGMCVSGLLGQLIVYNNDRDYSVLLYYSLAGIVEKYIYIPCSHACFPLLSHN